MIIIVFIRKHYSKHLRMHKLFIYGTIKRGNTYHNFTKVCITQHSVTQDILHTDFLKLTIEIWTV